MILAALMLALAPPSMPICPPGPRDNCIVDGDTLWWQGERIRIADIDAPEMQGRCPYETQLAIRARDRLAELLGNGFAIHRGGVDRYQRTLAVVTVDGMSVGEVLVSEGLARPWAGRREPWC